MSAHSFVVVQGHVAYRNFTLTGSYTCVKRSKVVRLTIHRGGGSCNVRNVVVVVAIILRGVFIIATYVFVHKVFSLFQGEYTPTCRLNW